MGPEREREVRAEWQWESQRARSGDPGVQGVTGVQVNIAHGRVDVVLQTTRLWVREAGGRDAGCGTRTQPQQSSQVGTWLVLPALPGSREKEKKNWQ